MKCLKHNLSDTMKENDDGLIELDSRNLDEFLYKLGSDVGRSVWWKLWIKTKWKLEAIREKLEGSNEEINFLHYDLRRLGYAKRKNQPLRLRYFNKYGELKSARFIVTWFYGSYLIKESKFPLVKPGKPLKGPMTIKKGRCYKRKISFTGFVRSWEVSFNSTL